MKTGIVILNYNSIFLTRPLVEKCISFSSLDYIVVVDNNSEDDCNTLKLLSSKVIVINRKKNEGYAVGNNDGFRYLKEKCGCDIAFLANPDVLFSEKEIIDIRDFIINNPEYCIVSSKREDNSYGKNPLQFWKQPNYFECLLEASYLFRRYNYRRRRLKSNSIINVASPYIDVDVVPGAFFGCDLNKMKQINYLDEFTFLWFEENCVSAKCDKAGYKRALLLGEHLYSHNHISKGRGNRLFSKYNKSKEYYAITYLHLGFFRMNLLRIADFFSNFEQKCLNILGTVLKHR